MTDAAGRLEGIARINQLFANGEHRIGEIMETEHEAVRYKIDQEGIAVLATQLNMITVPVVDEDQKLIGAVPPEALFKILRDEPMEDLQRLAGIAPHEHGPNVALDASLHDRIGRRLPWMIFGLAASAAITFAMMRFEHALSANAAVAFLSRRLSISRGQSEPRPSRYRIGSRPAHSQQRSLMHCAANGNSEPKATLL